MHRLNCFSALEQIVQKMSLPYCRKLQQVTTRSGKASICGRGRLGDASIFLLFTAQDLQ